ncbi:conserved hypothetical protein [Pyrobaculum islandicum DSM 4184]|uniref:Uncharacterized protein n=1 Tax=Pyrobaculum islandicum (strain DSM 4184 / JCM 9189 / GEO3) TaxID=384616 RepID=A1RUZ0_PYRIL|nr:hypothetical protein [Pyrobaculum islandicum]ABL88772.1 conserved hypothetical protein [Pyrobaculum islandicum DSM 4184]
MSVVGIRFDYIHAERFGAPPPGAQLQMNVQVMIEGERAVKRGGTIELPFTVSIASSPSVVTVTIRGTAVIQGEVDVKNLPPQVAGPIMQAALFEAALVMRELGFPPPLPIQPQSQQTPHYA